MRSGPDAMQLVGREPEQARIAEAIAAVAAGGSRVLLLTGEPGIGKTALLGRACREASTAGLSVVVGRATEEEADVPFGLVVDALDDEAAQLDPGRAARLRPELARVLPALGGDAGHPEQRRDEGAAPRIALHRALRGFIDEFAAGDAVALVLDDLHWADDASLEWVLHLMRRPPRAPVLLVLALRPVAPLASLLGALRDSVPGDHVEVGALSREAAIELLAEVPDEARRRRYLDEAGGNPLFLTGLNRLGDDPDRLPPTVLAAVELEVAAVGATARRLIEGAAIVGDPFEADGALVASGLGRDGLTALDELVAADLVRSLEGRTFAFRHPLVRRAVHDAMPAGARLEAHARMVRSLEALGAPVERIAHHVERSASMGDAAAAATLVRAAREVGARAPRSATGWLRTALDLDPGGPPAERCGLLVELAGLLSASGRLAEAREALLDAMSLVGPAAVDTRVDLTAALAGVEHALGRHDAARGRLRAALDGLPDDVADEIRARLVFQLTIDASYRQDSAELRRLAGTSSQMLRPVDPIGAVCDDAMAVLAAIWTGHGEEVEWRSASVHGQIEALGDRELPGRPFMAYVVGMTALIAEDMDASERQVAQGRAALRAGRDETAFASFVGLAAMVAVARGDARSAREAARELEETARLNGVGTGLAQALWLRASIAMLDGDLEDASRAAAEWPEVVASLPDIQMVRSGELQFAMLRAADDPGGAAEAILRLAGPAFDRVEPAFTARKVIPACVHALLAAGDVPEARRVAAIGDRMAAHLGLPVTRAAMQIARAGLALAEDDAATALQLADDAAASAATRRFGEEWFAADLTAARALGRLGRRDEAVERLRAAADRAAAGGAWALRDAVARELRRLGSRLPTVLRARDEEGELTDRERQIAELVGAGRTNKEVGRMLFLSPKTVEHTLSRIYAKLGVRGRAGLAAALAAQPSN